MHNLLSVEDEHSDARGTVVLYFPAEGPDERGVMQLPLLRLGA
jgi:hypothetical protein